MNNEKHISPESKELPPFPGIRDLIIIDDHYFQCISAHAGGVIVVPIEDRSKVVQIPIAEWAKYEFTPHSREIIDAGGLVEHGFMSKEQLAQVYWGSEEEKVPHLKEKVTFFGIYSKKK